jgi:hypothetical protein
MPHSITDEAREKIEQHADEPDKSANLPEWLGNTPQQDSYELVVEDGLSGNWMQCVELTREELIALKGHLAKIRGIARAEQRDEETPPDSNDPAVTKRENEMLSIVQRICRQHSGCTSPFEAFVLSVLNQAHVGPWPTPDDVEDELKEFRENFELTTKWMRTFAGQYPEAMKSEEKDWARPAVDVATRRFGAGLFLRGAPVRVRGGHAPRRK